MTTEVARVERWSQVYNSQRNGSVRLGGIIFLTLIIGSVAAASDDVLKVTATRYPWSVEQFGGTVSVITAADIRRHQYQDLAEVLRDIPGVSVASTGGRGSQASVFVRGSESNHVLILIDGIEVTDPVSSTFRFENLQLHNIERVEVLRGTHSAQHGSEAIGGVINIITRRADEKTRGNVQVSAGSFDSYRTSASLDGRYQDFEFALTGNYFDTEGQSHTARRLRGASSENDGYENAELGVNGGWQINSLFRLDGYYANNNADVEYDSDTPPYESDDCRERVDSGRRGFKLSGTAGIWQGYWQASRYHQRADNRCDFDSLTRGERDKFEWHNHFRVSDVFGVSAGAETELEQMHTTSAADGYSARNNAIYAEASVFPLPGLTITGSVRNDDPDDFDSERSERVALSYTPGSGRWHWRANYATGFKSPSLCDRFCDWGNDTLSPENSDAWEAGVDGNLTRRIKVGVVYFENSIRNLIEYDFASATLMNVGKADIQGMEASVRYAIDETMTIYADYTLLSVLDEQRQHLARRPLRTASARWEWSPDSLYAVALRAEYVGKRADVRRDTFAPVRKGGYTLVHLAARRQINEQFDLTLKVDNVLDKNYESADGYAGNGFAVYAGFALHY